MAPPRLGRRAAAGGAGAAAAAGGGRGRPLDGVRVLELGGLAPAPFAGLVLADFGADVVRIDRPGAGGGLSADALGGGRRSLLLDLKQPAGRAVFLRLVKGADVLVEPFRPGVMERLGLGPSVLLEANPRLVVARLTGWGQPPAPLPGADADEKQRAWHGSAGHDTNYLAMSGVLSLFGRQGEPPVPPMNVLGDFAAGGFLCAFGVLAALLERERSGRGQVVDAAIVDGAAYMGSWVAAQLARGMFGDERGTNLLDTGAPFYECYACADAGGYVSVGSLEPQFYAALLRGFVEEGVMTDKDVENLPDQHDRERWPELKAAFTAAFKQRTRDQWDARFGGTDACVAPVLSQAEAAEHPLGQARNLYLRYASEEHGHAKMRAAPAPRLSASPAQGDTRPFPAFGRDTATVLAEYGFPERTVKQLLQDRIVAAAENEDPASAENTAPPPKAPKAKL